MAHNKGGLSSKDIRRLQFFLTANYEDILLAWSMFFGKDYHFDRCTARTSSKRRDGITSPSLLRLNARLVDTHRL
ncbi:hypothetical protein [Bifidobacterium biavatii]|uniref:hypothetical protein n=1 Tax=Bifidobacterium biavatii TaxID=762212 RepID=UPI000B1D5C6B|nr:hypothetical protein [Bifidobacterium biavatii]